MENGKIKVLLIESDQANTELLHKMLSEEKDPSFLVEKASSLNGGMKSLGEKPSDVVLLNLFLSDSQGLDTFVKLNTKMPEVPVVVLTGLNDQQLALETVKKGAQDYLIKGVVDGRILSRVMRYAIERNRFTEEAKIAHKKLGESYAELKRLDQLKSDFISSVSHELHTPLTVITVAVNNFLDGIFGKLSDLQLKWIDRIKASTTRLTTLIDDVLDLSKLESGKAQIRFEKFNLAERVSNAVTELSTLAQEKKIDLKARLPKGPVEVSASKTRVDQVIVNLITNAVKYSGEGTKVTVEVQKSDRAAQVTVSDNGQGIDPSKLEIIFDRFMQLGDDKTATPGIGLGLAICKEIISLHRGRIWAESDGVGKGSRFIFTLPVESPKEYAVPRILVVDDDENVLYLYEITLEELECKTVFAKDGAEAIAQIISSGTHDRFDLMFCDLQLPVRNGVQVIKEMKRVSPDTSIIVATGYPDSQLVLEALTVGHFMMLKKPFEPEELRSIYKTFIRQMAKE